MFVSQKKQTSDLQTEENKAFRYTVNARKCTAISALRGEMGASLQKTRDMKTKILFLRHILTDNNLTLSDSIKKIKIFSGESIKFSGFLFFIHAVVFCVYTALSYDVLYKSVYILKEHKIWNPTI